MEGREVL